MKAALSRTRTGEVIEAIRVRIANRALSQGDRLPSIRAFAKTMGVSPSTVVEAYDRLASEGVVRSRPGSGFYVSTGLPARVLDELPPPTDRAIDPLWVSRQSLDAAPQTRKPGCGWLPSEWMPNAIVRRAVRGLARADDTVLANYGATRGSLDLRRLLARRCAREGLDIAPEQLLLTTSGTQAIDLICRLLLRPGDTVLVDDPCYFNFQALLRVHHAKIVGVPYTPSGPDTTLFAAALAEHRPRLYITNSAIHNPTGATMSAQTAHKLLTAAAAYGLIVVEDDIFAEFEPEPSPRLAVFDGLTSVIRIGSFSKTLSASVRCGYVVARPDWLEALIDLQVATNFGGASPMAAQLVFNALMDSGYRRHVDALQRRLSSTRREVATKLADLGFETWVTPRGGFFLWSRLPDGGKSAAQFAKAALREDMILAPGAVFSPSQTDSDFMRFNVAQMQDPRMFDGLRTALAR